MCYVKDDSVRWSNYGCTAALKRSRFEEVVTSLITALNGLSRLPFLETGIYE